MKQYLDVLADITEKGVEKDGRGGMSRVLFGPQMRFKMESGFPAVTTKKLAFRNVAIELFWFLSGCSDNNELNRLGCHIWDTDAHSPEWTAKGKEDGDLGRIYGVQWRSWRGANGQTYDQLENAVDKIRHEPNSRRIIVSAWNVAELDEMVLPPCHVLFQFFPIGEKLSLAMYQRSADMFLGVPFNIASYAMLLHIVSQITSRVADELIINLGDAHIYYGHFEQVKEQLSRTPRPLPKLWLNPDIKTFGYLGIKNIKEPNDIYKMVKLEGYDPHPAIKAALTT